MAGFELSQRIQQGMRQEMLLQPRMLQSIEVLQLPALELESYLNEALQENEALRLDEPPGAGHTVSLDAGLGPAARRREGAEAAERFDAWLENQPAHEGGLVEALEAQLGMLELDAELEPWAHLVVQCLDPRGYLSVSDERILALAEEAGLAADAGTLGRAIAIVQQLEPRGVGGRDAVEALLLQLDPGEPDYALLCRLLEEFLEDVARNKLPAVARALEVDLACLDRLVVRIRELHLRPGAELAPSSSPPIRPDVVVERTSSGFEVRVAASGLPALSIDEGIRSLARDRKQPTAVRRYLRDKIERARWLVDALAQRQRTLLRIATALFEHQRLFLEHGPRQLVPLRMNQLADELELHVSTVSRAVAGKYAETPFGIRALRFFFQGAAGGEDTAARSNVRDMVRELIEAEEPDRPLSDDELVAKLREQGVRLARRTVAKYRGELGIPSSYRRRRWR